jgi:hypothetical protein
MSDGRAGGPAGDAPPAGHAGWGDRPRPPGQGRGKGRRPSGRPATRVRPAAGGHPAARHRNAGRYGPQTTPAPPEAGSGPGAGSTCPAAGSPTSCRPRSRTCSSTGPSPRSPAGDKAVERLAAGPYRRGMPIAVRRAEPADLPALPEIEGAADLLFAPLGIVFPPGPTVIEEAIRDGERIYVAGDRRSGSPPSVSETAAPIWSRSPCIPVTAAVVSAPRLWSRSSRMQPRSDLPASL